MTKIESNQKQFEIEDNDLKKRPREYLIPQFVAECCIQNKIDGIKCYGGKDYSNYVTWKDSYFGFIRNLGDTDV